MYGLLITIIDNNYNNCQRCKYLKTWNLREQKNLHIKKISITIVQMKFLAMHITNQN